MSLIGLLADAGETGGALTANRATFREGSPGAPAHFHTKATEMFYVLEGTMRFLVNDEIVTVGKGGFLTVPPTVPHAFSVSPRRTCSGWSAPMPWPSVVSCCSADGRATCSDRGGCSLPGSGSPDI
ncbi:cupin domain-containing protein [Rhodococcus spelaei]|uniref:cupin domain-containing protein n=1 Tax=Rhodococcus spelaei TaxID=2546320 RepID=UPI001C684A5F